MERKASYGAFLSVYNNAMSAEKTPRKIVRSFADIPRPQAKPAAEIGNKASSFKEDLYNLGHPADTDGPSEYAPKVAQQKKSETVSESREATMLRKRIAYYESSTLEDSEMKTLQLQQLRQRLAQMEEKESSQALAEEPIVPTVPKKTGWWNRKTRFGSELPVGSWYGNRSPETPATSQKEDVTKRVPKDPKQMSDQMDRLVSKVGNLRKEAGLSHAQAREQSPEYVKLRSEITRIRYRLNKIQSGEGKEEYKEEIAQLRHELAENLIAFKKLSRELSTDTPSVVETPEVIPSKSEAEVLNEPSREEPVPAEKKAYEERLLVRTKWKQTQKAYLDAYEQHLAESKRARNSLTGKLAFWKKETKSQTLLDTEAAYQEARKEYVVTLDAALTSRIKNVSMPEDADTALPEEQIEGLRAGLANRFVMRAAFDKLEREKEYLPDAKSLRIFESASEALKKHKRLIKASGYVLVAGVGLVSGGIGAAVLALGSRAVTAQVATVAVLGGATLGAHLSNSLSDTVIDYTEQRRDSSLQKAQRTFSVASMEKLEEAYENRYRSHEKALRDKNFYVGLGTVAGGTLGAIAVGNLDSAVDVPTESLPNPNSSVDIVSGPQAETTPVVPALEDGSDELSPEAFVQQQQEAQLPGVLQGHDDLGVDAPVLPALEGGADDLTPEEFVRQQEEAGVSGIPDSADVLYFESPQQLSDADELTPQQFVEQQLANEGGADIPPLLHTFEAGDRVDTVSEALFEEWKENGAVADAATSNEFLAQMYAAIAELERDPQQNSELMEQMGIASGDINVVEAGQTIDLQPFFEYMNQRN